MQKAFYITVFLYLLLLSGACKRTTDIRTGWGLESIPNSCSAFTDGCHVYCRTSATSFDRTTLKDLCKDEDLHASNCIDDEPEQLKLCENNK